MDLNATEARRQFLTLIEDLPSEGVLITKRGKPLARLIPVQKPRKGRMVTGALVRTKGKPGPLAPTTATPYDLLFD
jgi:prevent-host-death family protein